MNAATVTRPSANRDHAATRRLVRFGCYRRPAAQITAWTSQLVMLACLAIPGAALGQPQPFRSGPMVQHFLPKVIVNEPNYAIIERASGSTRNKLKQVEVTCPDGMRAMSAGFSAASGRGEPDDWRVFLSQPTDDGRGWTVFAMFDGTGGKNANGVSGVPAPYEWALRVRIVCARNA